MFKVLKDKIEMGNKWWNFLEVLDLVLFLWDLKFIYIRCFLFFDKFIKELIVFQVIENVYVLLYLGDFVIIDYILFVGSIVRNSVVVKYLINRGFIFCEFNFYGV